MRITADLPCPNRTRALIPGTMRLLQPRQVYLFREGSSLTLYLSLTLLARAACSLAIPRSFGARLTEDSVSRLTSSAASFRDAFRVLTPGRLLPKVLTILVEPAPGEAQL